MRITRVPLLALVLLAGCSRPDSGTTNSSQSQAHQVAAAEQFRFYPIADPAAAREGIRQVRAAETMPLEGAYATGRKDAPVVLVEFGDFGCSFCARSHGATYMLLDSLVEAGTVRHIFGDFPIPTVPGAGFAALAARCAGSTEGPASFWKLHHAYLAQQALWSHASDYTKALRAIAGNAGVQGAAFNQCYDELKEAPAIERLRSTALRLGVSGTPTHFINGVPFTGALNEASLRNIVQDAATIPVDTLLARAGWSLIP